MRAWIALLRREMRAGALWAGLQCFVAMVGNADHVLYRFAHEATARSLHGFDTEAAMSFAMVEFGLAFAMAQRIAVREAEEGSLGALDALPISRWSVFVAKTVVCVSWIALGALTGFAVTLAFTASARSSLAPGWQWQAHTLFAFASLSVGIVGAALGLATAPWRNAAFGAAALYLALIALAERVSPSMRVCNVLYLHTAWLRGDQWVGSLDAMRTQCLGALVLGFVGALRFRVLARTSGDGTVRVRTSSKRWWLLGAVLVIPTACVMGLSLLGVSAMTERVPTARYVFVLPRGTRTDSATLLTNADAVHDRVQARYGAHPPVAITVDATQTLTHLGRAGEASGLAVALDRGVVTQGTDALAVLAHETSHAFTALTSRWKLTGAPARATRVFEEGLATVIEHDEVGNRGRDGALVLAALRRRGLLRADVLVDFEALEAVGDPDLAYPLGEAFVRAMMDLWGRDAPVRVLRTFGARERGWNLRGAALWREVMSDAGMSYDRTVDRTFARIDAQLDARGREVEALPALRAVVALDASTLTVRAEAVPVPPATQVEGVPRAVCRMRDPTDTSTDRYVVAPAPCTLARRHFAGPIVEVSVGLLVGDFGDDGVPRDGVADVIYEPWLRLRVDRGGLPEQ